MSRLPTAISLLILFLAPCVDITTIGSPGSPSVKSSELVDRQTGISDGAAVSSQPGPGTELRVVFIATVGGLVRPCLGDWEQ